MSLKFFPLATIALIATLSFSLAADSVDQEAKHKIIREIHRTVKSFDANDDDRLDKTERTAVDKAVAEEHGEDWVGPVREVLDEADVDSNGVLTNAEWLQYVEPVVGKVAAGKKKRERTKEKKRSRENDVTLLAISDGPYSFLSQAEKDKKIIPDRVPGYLLFEENIVYTPGPDTKLRNLDILYHADHDTVKRPVILVIHGGGWRGGDKIRGHEIMAIYALQGYVTVSVNYRLAPEFIAPTQVHDVKLSVRWLRANAAEYGIDPDRIGCTGGSAGGHLTAMVAVTDPSDDLEGPYLSEYSSAVQAAMPLSGVFDLRGSDKRFVDPFLGGAYESRKPGLSERMSPTWLLNSEKAKTIPPMLVAHSDNEMVPVDQVEGFMDELKSIGRNDPLILLPGKLHGHKLIQVKVVREAADKLFEEHLQPQPPAMDQE